MADLIGLMLGTLFLTLGLAASIAVPLRASREERDLLWFGLFTALYGLRIVARNDIVHDVVPSFTHVLVAAGDQITYVILVPGALLASSALKHGWRGVLAFVWRVDLACASVAIAWDLAAGRTGAAMPFNQTLVVANIGIAVLSVALDGRSRQWTRDGWIVLAGAAVFAATVLFKTIRDDDDSGQLDPEPLAMLAVIACLGYVVVKHVFHSERRIAAVGRELETARQIQQSILPKHVPRVPGLTVAAHYDSMSEVAGDLYDFVITPSGQLGVLVADVSGHGVPAAIVASMVKVALAAQEGDIGDPGAVLTRMNRVLCGRFELAYVTAVFALIDPAARTLTYASAGHPSPLLLRGGGGLESLDHRGIVLGFLPAATYTSAVVRDLSVGDRLVLYTDGITEAERPDGEFFGDRQFHELFMTSRELSADRFMATLVQAARRWVGADFADDVTAIVVDRVES